MARNFERIKKRQPSISQTLAESKMLYGNFIKRRFLQSLSDALRPPIASILSGPTDTNHQMGLCCKSERTAECFDSQLQTTPLPT